MTIVALMAVGLLLGQAGRQSHVDKGHLLREQNDLQGAEAEYKQALWFDKKSAPALAGMGMISHLRGDLKAAVQSYRASLKEVEEQPEVRLFLADALFELDERDAALTEYRLVAPKLKKSLQLHNNFGVALFAKGDLKPALNEFKEAAALVRAGPVDSGGENKALPPCVSDIFTPQFNLGIGLARNGDTAGALAQYAKAAASGASREGYARLGRALKASGAVDAAITNWSRALQVAEPECSRVTRGKPENYFVAERQTMAVADIYFQLGNALQERGDLQRALVQFQRAQSVLSSADAVSESALKQRIQALKDKLEPKGKNDDNGLTRTEPVLRALGVAWYAHAVLLPKTVEVPSGCARASGAAATLEYMGNGFRCVQKLRANSELIAELEVELKANRKPGITPQKRHEKVLAALATSKNGTNECAPGWSYQLGFIDAKQDILERLCWRAIDKAEACGEGEYEPGVKGCVRRQCEEGAEDTEGGGTRGCIRCPAGVFDAKQTLAWSKKEGRKAAGLVLCKVSVNP